MYLFLILSLFKNFLLILNFHSIEFVFIFLIFSSNDSNIRELVPGIRLQKRAALSISNIVLSLVTSVDKYPLGLCCLTSLTKITPIRTDPFYQAWFLASDTGTSFMINILPILLVWLKPCIHSFFIDGYPYDCVIIRFP